MMNKEAMKSLLKGMSPDLTDNVIVLCGGTCYDCYRIMREDAGVMRKRMESNDMLAMLNIGAGGEHIVDTRIERPVRKITNATHILNILSTI